jgi:hypothetical protein
MYSLEKQNEKRQRAMLQADIIAAEAIKKLGGRKFRNLTLEEALEIKELADLGAKGAYPGIRELSVGLDEYVKSPYGLEGARDQVEALDAAYKHKSKLHKEMEELKILLETNGRDIGMAKTAPFSFGEDKHARYSFIKRAEEGSKMMIEELEQKTKEIHLVDAEISRLISEIGRLKGAYLSEHPRPDANISWEDKMIAWGGLLRSAQQAAAREAASARSKMGGLQRSNFMREEKKAAEAAMRWAERMQGVVLPPPPPADRRAASPSRESRGAFAARLRSVQRANKQARNTAELNALSALNRRESRNAAAAIFSNKSKKNKPKWGIPNVGTGFGGRRTRRNSRRRRG